MNSIKIPNNGGGSPTPELKLHLDSSQHQTSWNPKHPIENGCFNWMMVPKSLPWKNGCFTISIQLKIGCLELQVWQLIIVDLRESPCRDGSWRYTNPTVVEKHIFLLIFSTGKNTRVFRPKLNPVDLPTGWACRLQIAAVICQWSFFSDYDIHL